MHLSPKDKPEWRHVAISILIGACIAFLSAIIEGLRVFLTEPGTHITSSGAGMLWYILRIRA